MKLNEQRACAAETLKYFIQTMPDVPFTEEDIVFEFTKKSDMAKRAVELCAVYCPDKILNDSQRRQLNQSITANALIGRGKSAVLIRIHSDIGKKDFAGLSTTNSCTYIAANWKWTETILLTYTAAAPHRKSPPKIENTIAW